MQELCEIVVGSFLVAFTLTAGSSAAAEAQQAGKISFYPGNDIQPGVAGEVTRTSTSTVLFRADKVIK